MTVFLRLTAVALEQKAISLKNMVQTGQGDLFIADAEDFRKIPGSPFAYWLSDTVRSLFSNGLTVSSSLLVASGTGSLSDARFLRLWTEVPHGIPIKWFPYAKGGSYAPVYFDHHLAVNWEDDGAEMKASVIHRYGGGHWARNIRSTEHYFRPGLTWPRRTNGLSFRLLPAGCIFADKGPAAFAAENDPETLLAMSCIMNSKTFAYLVAAQLARTELAQSYEVGIIQTTPIPDIPPSVRGELASIAREIWDIGRKLDASNELSHVFMGPRPLISNIIGHEGYHRQRMRDLTNLAEEITMNLYNLSLEDRELVAAIGKPSNSDDEENEDEEPALSPNEDMALLSWAVGVAFGRFHQRLIAREDKASLALQPFERLPERSPAMVSENDLLTTSAKPILVEDAGHGDDLANKVLSVLNGSGATSKFNTRSEVADIISRKFFDYHLAIYSKSRRKAPIWWRLSPEGSQYALWLSYHQLNRDTIFRALNEYVTPRLLYERTQLDAIEAAGDDELANPLKREARVSTVADMETLAQELRLLAPIWSPELSDGVLLNFAPLWRLASHNKNWQRQLRAAWEDLANGTYDWARLAMHLWPERVIPKCVTDRSLAIAHDLVEVFWLVGEGEKWVPRKLQASAVEDLIAERTSLAVKAALKQFSEAPEPVAAKRPRKNKGR